MSEPTPEQMRCGFALYGPPAICTCGTCVANDQKPPLLARVHPLAPESSYIDDVDDDEYLVVEDDEMDEADMNCQMNRSGQCSAAGSKYCEFECPYRDE